jgi:putative spermidine/putrescine transport system permease protein
VGLDPADRMLAIAGWIVRPLVYVGLCLPAVIIVAASFTAGDALRFPPEGLSLRWYEAALSSDPFMNSLWTSVKLACLATIGALSIGLSAAMALDRYRFRGREVIRSLTLSPLVVPMVVLGIALLQFLAWMKLNQTYVGLLAGHVLITLPYVVRTLSASLVLFDRSIEQAAANLRATPWRVLRLVTLPILLPAIVSATVFAFVTSFGNVTLSIFLGTSRATTLPVQIFTYVEQNYDPVLAAVSALVILVTLVVIVIIEKLVGVERVA